MTLNTIKESVGLPFEMQSDGKNARKKEIILSYLEHKLINKYLYTDLRLVVVHKHKWADTTLMSETTLVSLDTSSPIGKRSYKGFKSTNL